MRRLIGQGAKITQKNLTPCSTIPFTIELTDSLGKKFHRSSEFQTDSQGILNISEYELQREIWQASNDQMVKYFFKLNFFIFYIYLFFLSVRLF